MKVIYAFGDSITYGAWDQQASGWTSLLRQHLDLTEPFPGYYFYELGIHGETTNGLMKRLDNEIEVRQRQDDDSYTFIFAHGANDATWLTGESRFKASIEDYEANLRTAIQKAKSLNASIYILGITPVNEEYSTDLVARGKSCINKYVDIYDSKARAVAQSESVSFIDINGAFKAAGPNNLLVPDGLHPNEAGHKLIFKTVCSALTG